MPDELPEGSPVIRAALDAIGAMNTEKTTRWLAGCNPLALRTLLNMPAAVDSAAIGGDADTLARACAAWVNSWKFWCGNCK